MGAFAILSSTMSKSPVLNPFAKSLGTPTDLLGIVAAASTIPGIIISLPAASLSDIIGRRKVLLFSAFVFASAPFMYLFVTSWWQLVLVRFYHGFATAIFVPVTEATVAERFPSKRGERISILNSATGAGRTVAPTLGGVILGLTNNGFSTLYLAVSVAGVTAFVIAFFLLTEKNKSEIQTSDVSNSTRKMFQGWRQLVRNRAVLSVSFVQASQYYAFGAAEFFIVGYAIDVANLSGFYYGPILSALTIAIIIARPAMGRFSDRRGRRLPIVTGSFIGALMLLAIPFSTSFVLLFGLAVGFGLGFAFVVSSTSPLMVELTSARLVGSSMGFLSTMMDVGQTLGPILSGVIGAFAVARVGQVNYAAIFVSLSLLLIISSVVFVFSKAAKKKEM
jgi:DHA1 family multidrug resistance protein-like MFS transporter